MKIKGAKQIIEKNVILIKERKIAYPSLYSQGENNDNLSLENKKNNTRRTLKEELTFSLNFYLKH